MGDFVNILKSSLEFYDKNSYKYYDLFKTFKYYKFIKPERKILFFDRDKRKCFEANFEIIGKYIVPLSTWVWGWSMAEYNKEQIKTVRKLLNYALDLDVPSNLELKTELISQQTQVFANYQRDIYVAMACFLSKKEKIFILNIAEKPDKTQDLVKIPKFTDNVMESYFIILD